MHSPLFILREDDADAGIKLLEMCVGHKPGRTITSHLHYL